MKEIALTGGGATRLYFVEEVQVNNSCQYMISQ